MAKKADLTVHPDYGADFEPHKPVDEPTSQVIVNADAMAERAEKAEKEAAKAEKAEKAPAKK